MTSHEEIVAAAARIEALAQAQPELFDTKKRAKGMGGRVACWWLGMGIGWTLDYWLTGSASSPFQFMTGMTAAAAFVYFDPPSIVTTRKLRDRDAAPRKAAGLEAEGQQPGPEGYRHTSGSQVINNTPLPHTQGD